MLWIADDVFTIHHGWLAEFRAELSRRRIRIPFECISRADRINAHVADLLADLHCFRVWIGSESGSQRMLDAMQHAVRGVWAAIGGFIRDHPGVISGMRAVYRNLYPDEPNVPFDRNWLLMVIGNAAVALLLACVIFRRREVPYGAD